MKKIGDSLHICIFVFYFYLLLKMGIYTHNTGLFTCLQEISIYLSLTWPRYRPREMEARE